MMRKLVLAGLAVGLVLSSIGCRTCRKKCDVCGPSGGYRLGEPVRPSPFGETIPPPAVPTTPAPLDNSLPPAAVPETRGSFRMDSALPPPLIPKETAPTPPPAVPAPSPVTPTPPREPAKELLLPDPLPGSSSSAKPSTSGFLDTPVQPGQPIRATPPPPASAPAKVLEPTTSKDLPTAPKSVAPSAVAPRDANSARSTVGLPGFAVVPGKSDVYAGRRPTLDGFDRLKSSGFRSVVYLHSPSADVSAARELVEKRSLKFVGIPVSAANLGKAATRFDEVIADRASRPVYVCDEDGLRAGFLWYLHFRTVDAFSDDAAKVRATPLGLRDADTEETKQFWVATQQILANR